MVLARVSSSWPALERKERSAEAGFVQTFETGAMLENIAANGASSGVQVVTNRNSGRHVLRGGTNQNNKPKRGQGANRNGNPSNPNRGTTRQQGRVQTNNQNIKNSGPGFKQTYQPGSQYQNIKCGDVAGCTAEPVRTAGANNNQKSNVNQGGNNANGRKNNSNTQNAKNRGANNITNVRQRPNRQKANTRPNNTSNQNRRGNNRKNNRQENIKQKNAQRNSQNTQNQRAKNKQNRTKTDSGFNQTYEHGSQYQNFKCGTTGCLGGQVRTA